MENNPDNNEVESDSESESIEIVKTSPESHPLETHDFLGDNDEINKLKEARRAQMEKIESDPEAYIKADKLRRAREKASQFMNRIKNRDIEPDIVDNVSDDGEIYDENSVETSIPIGVGGVPDYDDVCMDTPQSRGNTVIHIHHVDNIVFKL
jgi:hypothetical protein